MPQKSGRVGVQGIAQGAKTRRPLRPRRPATQIDLGCKTAAAHGVQESHCNGAGNDDCVRRARVETQ